MNEIASRYAESLYSLAYEANEVSIWQAEAKEIKKILLDNPKFIYVLSSSFTDLKEKEELIDKCFKGVRKEMVNFIKIIIKNHRQKYLLDIFDAFNSECNLYRGVKEGYLYSTYRLDDKTLKSISNAVSKKEGKEVELYNHIDPTLIGGIRVVIDGHIYDDSIKSRLNRMKESLLK